MPDTLTGAEDAQYGARAVVPGPIPENRAMEAIEHLNAFFAIVETARAENDPDTLYEIGNRTDDEGPAIADHPTDIAWMAATRAFVKQHADAAYGDWAEDRREGSRSDDWKLRADR